MKTISIAPIGGLGNRMLAISSFLSYCKKMNYRLRILWIPDKGLLCPLPDLFDFSERDDVEIKEITGWRRLLFDYPRKSVLWLSPISHYFLFAKRIYLKEYYSFWDIQNPAEELTQRIEKADSVYIVACRNLFEEKKMNLPTISDNVKKELQTIISEFTPDTVGIHIRRTDNIQSISSSPLSLYVEKMNEELKKNPKTMFYVASDSLDEKEKLKELFPDKIITSATEVRRDSKSGIIFALAEMYALAKTSKIYGSQYSTFAIVAGKIHPTEIHLF